MQEKRVFYTVVISILILVKMILFDNSMEKLIAFCLDQNMKITCSRDIFSIRSTYPVCIYRTRSFEMFHARKCVVDAIRYSFPKEIM